MTAMDKIVEAAGRPSGTVFVTLTPGGGGAEYRRFHARRDAYALVERTLRAGKTGHVYVVVPRNDYVPNAEGLHLVELLIEFTDASLDRSGSLAIRSLGVQPMRVGPWPRAASPWPMHNRTQRDGEIAHQMTEARRVK